MLQDSGYILTSGPALQKIVEFSLIHSTSPQPKLWLKERKHPYFTVARYFNFSMHILSISLDLL